MINNQSVASSEDLSNAKRLACTNEPSPALLVQQQQPIAATVTSVSKGCMLHKLNRSTLHHAVGGKAHPSSDNDQR